MRRVLIFSVRLFLNILCLLNVMLLYSLLSVITVCAIPLDPCIVMIIMGLLFVSITVDRLATVLFAPVDQNDLETMCLFKNLSKKSLHVCKILTGVSVLVAVNVAFDLSDMGMVKEFMHLSTDTTKLKLMLASLPNFVSNPIMGLIISCHGKSDAVVQDMVLAFKGAYKFPYVSTVCFVMFTTLAALSTTIALDAKIYEVRSEKLSGKVR